MRAVIIGGGIGGKSSALFLSRLKTLTDEKLFHEIVVLEQSSSKISKFRPYIGLWTNSLNLLRSINVLDTTHWHIRMIEDSGYRARNGDWLIQPHLKLNNIKNGFPALGFIRCDILEEALDTASRNCANIRFEDSITVQHISKELNSWEFTAVTDSGLKQLYRPDLLIAADGSLSSTRESLNMSIGGLRYRGYHVFRGLSLAKLPSNVAFQTWGPECRFAAVAVKVDKNTDGTSWFAAISGPKNTLHYKYPDISESYPFRNGAEPVTGKEMDNLKQRLSKWHDPIGRILDESDLSSVSVDESLSSEGYSRGDFACSGAIHPPIFFVGDARFTSDPLLAQGAGMAVEDAAAVGQAISASLSDNTSQVDWASAVRKYHESRARRTLVIQVLSDLAMIVSTSSWERTRNFFLKALPQQWKGSAFDAVLKLLVKP